VIIMAMPNLWTLGLVPFIVTYFSTRAGHHRQCCRPRESEGPDGRPQVKGTGSHGVDASLR
jgi:hypothetical protein